MWGESKADAETEERKEWEETICDSVTKSSPRRVAEEQGAFGWVLFLSKTALTNPQKWEEKREKEEVASEVCKNSAVFVLAHCK